MSCKFGAHMSIAGGFDQSVRAAHRLGLQTLQVFTKSSNQWRARPMADGEAAAFRAALAETGVADPVAHTSYLINLASPDDALWKRSFEAMIIEVERAAALGISDLVVHPGAHMGTGEEAGLARCAAALDNVAKRTQGSGVTIDLESTAGQGTCLGHRLEHLGEILRLSTKPSRLGVCLDTCHLHAAGYAFADETDYNSLIEEIKSACGLARVRVWHLNDSRTPRGSRVDRHAAIGRGHIGLEAFRRVVNDLRFGEIPMILETPKGIENGVELDAINLRTLRELLAPAETAVRARTPRRPKRRGKELSS